MRRDSIMQPEYPWKGRNDPESRCYATGRMGCNDFHHIFEGISGYKRISEEQGLWCYLDHDVHMRAHSCQRPYETLLLDLRKLAQAKWETNMVREGSTRSEARRAWLQMMGKSWLQ